MVESAAPQRHDPQSLPACPTDQGNGRVYGDETKPGAAGQGWEQISGHHPASDPIRSDPLSSGATMGDGRCCTFLEILLAVILPPLGVFLRFGCCSVSPPPPPSLPP